MNDRRASGSAYSRVFAHFSHFFTSNMLGRVVGLLSFPILTRILSKEDYGIIGLASVTMFFLVALGKIGLSDGIIRLHHEFSDDPSRSTRFASSVLLGGGLWALFIAVIYLLVVPYMMKTMKIDLMYRSTFYLLAVSILLKPVSGIVSNTMRAEGKVLFLNVLGLLGRVLGVLLSIGTVLFVYRNSTGYMIGTVVAEGFLAGCLLYWYLSRHRIKLRSVSVAILRRLFYFGGPLLLSELCYLLLEYIDRYMLMRFYGEATVGVYSVGYNLSSYVSEIVTFSLAFAMVPIYVQVFEREGKAKAEEFLSKCTNYFFLSVVIITIEFTICAREIFGILASEKYQESSSIAPLILVGCFCIGSMPILNAGLYINRKTRAIFGIVSSAVVLNVALNIFLIPRYALKGAAIATLVAGIYVAVMMFVGTRRYLLIRIDVRKLVAYTLLGVIIYFAAGYVDGRSLWSSLIIKVIIANALIVPCLLFTERELIKYVINHSRTLVSAR